MQDSTRDGLNTLLSKVNGLRVFSREKIDFLRQRKGLSEIEVAEALGIQKMISGLVTTEGPNVVIEARVVDTSSGILDASESVRGHADDLIELQNQVASDLLAALGVQLSTDDRAQLFARRTKETLEVYRRMAETFGEAPEAAIGPPEQPERRSWLSIRPRAALAQEPEAAEAPIRAVLEAYRVALERKDVEAVAATHIELTPEQRTGFARYFGSADNLTVTVSDVDVLVVGDEALLTFTRRDAFLDRKSEKEVELEVRLSSEVVQKDGQWRLRGVKRSAD
jgi:TolB-like protein